MSRHRATRQPSGPERDAPQQLPLVAPVAKVRPRNVDPEVAAKIAIERRAKPSAVPGHVKLVLTIELPRAFAERLSAQSIREGKTFEGVLIEILLKGGGS
jgi:hypothetical protein